MPVTLSSAQTQQQQHQKSPQKALNCFVFSHRSAAASCGPRARERLPGSAHVRELGEIFVPRQA